MNWLQLFLFSLPLCQASFLYNMFMGGSKKQEAATVQQPTHTNSPPGQPQGIPRSNSRSIQGDSGFGRGRQISSVIPISPSNQRRDSSGSAHRSNSSHRFSLEQGSSTSDIRYNSPAQNSFSPRSFHDATV